MDNTEEGGQRSERKKVWPGVKDKAEGVITDTRIINQVPGASSEGNEEGNVTRHMAVALADPTLGSIDFQAGDVCYIGAVNNERQVDRLLEVLGADPERKVMFGGEETTIGDVLQKRIEIVRVSDNLLKFLAEQGKSGALAGRDFELIERAIEDSRLGGELKDNAIADLIRHFHIEGLDIEALVAHDDQLSRQESDRRLLLPMKNRAYTASSSPLMHPGEVHLTVARVDREAKIGNDVFSHHGVVSGQLDGLPTGSEVLFYMSPKPGFRLPPELDKPITMIGPGTGIAPFRAFIQEVEAGGKPHSGLVLYSGGKYHVDALYPEEFERAHAEGVLSAQPQYAISRAGDRQRVTHLLRKDAESIRELVGKGGLFYICGAEQMGKDVIDTLEQIAPELDKKAQVREDTY